MNKKLIAASAIIFSLIALPAQAATPRTVTVTSDGSVKVTPDAVRVDAQVNVVAASSTDALKAASTTATAVRAALTKNSVASKDIATQTLTIFPEYNYTQEKGSVLIGYRASQGFTITIRAAKNAGVIVDAIVAAGGNNLQVSGVTPFVIDDTKASSGARINAVAKAKAKAAHYAALLGVKLGSVTTIVESSAPSNIRQVFAMAKDSVGATQIDLGQQDVSVSITVTWTIN